MNDESRLEELLDEWEAACQQGREPAPETLCQDCPELLHELKQRVTRLKHVDRLLYPRSVEKTMPDAPATAGLDTGLDDGERRLGRYRLDALLGKGGFGEVWRAYDPELRRAVAIKVLRPERSLHPGQVERFQDEARKLAQLRHPNIVPVFDVGQSDGVAFIVSELVEGENLAAVLKGRRFGWTEAAGLVAKLADAADHAHGRGVIHRDINELVVPASVTVGDVSGLDPRARTGILAGKGERIVVKAAGQWRVGPLARHVKGPEILKVAIGMAGKPPTQLETVGERVEFVVEQPGELFLGTPDTSPGDNRGELNVSIDIEAE